MGNTKKINKKNRALSMERKLHSANASVLTSDTLYTIAIGASAGGLEALKEIFANSSLNSKMAFIIIMHLQPDHVSLIPTILQTFTKMEVISIVNGTKVEANKIYILPPNSSITLRSGILYLQLLTNSHEKKLPIDSFFKALAMDQGSKAISIILSGTGSDGSIGLRSIKEKNGLVVVQCPASSNYDGMPKSAINTGLVDYILPAREIFNFLTNYLAHTEDQTIPIEKSISDEIQQILVLLNAQTNHDFSSYKINTIFRRIQKRMIHLQLNSLSQYIQYLKENPSEATLLFKELLIHVTSFFRDPDSFTMLKTVLEDELRSRPKDYTFRVWVSGCATGEEAYSIAIILQECMERLKRYFNIQIFATDIDKDVIEKARSGIYSPHISSSVSDDRLNKYFIQENNHFKINIDIRKMIIFAVQNVIKDPPFTKLDLLICRNLLIYFDFQLQKKILPLFHYSLKPHGLLFLGTSETIGSATDLFDVVDHKWKIFRKQLGGFSSFQSVLDFPSITQFVEAEIKENMEHELQNNELKVGSFLEKYLLEIYAPPCIIVDDKENLIYVYGRTSKYLEFPSGEACLRILDIIRPELKSKLAAGMRKTYAQQKEHIYSDIQIKNGKEFSYVNLKITPLRLNQINETNLLLIVFEDSHYTKISVAKKTNSKKTKVDKKIHELEQELKYTQESLQTTIEELETSNEELKSSNEELQSTNEELQSTNEEMETSKEELQSLNEELTTVNSELESRVDQISGANEDIKNLLDNTEIATVFLDKDLCIKRFTPQATNIINLILADVGRPINHIVSNLHYHQLVEDAKQVLNTLKPKTIEVKDNSGNWYEIRIIPYRTVSNLIDGVVITFINIHSQKQIEQKIINSERKLLNEKIISNALLEAYPHPAILLDSKGVILNLNSGINSLIHTDLIGKLIDQALCWDKEILRNLITKGFQQGQAIDTFELESETISLEAKKISEEVLLLTVL